jgi:ribosomal protein S18 acetylase RimI-like enzyme
MSHQPMIRLSTMTDVQYPDYRAWFIEEYARDLCASHGYDLAQGRINATVSIDGYLPQGVASPDNVLYCIEAEDANATGGESYAPGRLAKPGDAGDDRQSWLVVGYLWVGYKTNSGFIYDFGILPPWQRRGYGRAALALLDEVLRARGVSELGLRVAADNPHAKALYDKCGFLVTGINMVKSLR